MAQDPGRFCDGYALYKTFSPSLLIPLIPRVFERIFKRVAPTWATVLTLPALARQDAPFTKRAERKQLSQMSSTVG